MRILTSRFIDNENSSVYKKNSSKIFIAICILFALLFSLQSREIVFAATNEYTVVFKANGGSGSMSNQKIIYNKATTLNECKFKRTGYKFKGWAESKNGTVKYKDKETVKKLAKAGEKINLYAVWKAEPTRRALILGETSTPEVPILDVNSMVAMMKRCTFSGQKMSSVVKYSNHTKAAIKKKIKSVFSDNKNDDVSYIYFTCHGNNDGSILIGSDGLSFTPKELKDFLDKNVKGTVVLMIDCCFSGMAIQNVGLGQQDIALANKNVDFGEIFISEFIDDTTNKKSGELAEKGYKVLCSSSAKEYSDGGDCSLATKYWTLGAGWDPIKGEEGSLLADGNKNNTVTLQELYTYSYKRVLKRESEQHIQVYPENSSFVLFGRY